MPFIEPLTTVSWLGGYVGWHNPTSRPMIMVSEAEIVSSNVYPRTDTCVLVHKNTIAHLLFTHINKDSVH